MQLHASRPSRRRQAGRLSAARRGGQVGTTRFRRHPEDGLRGVLVRGGRQLKKNVALGRQSVATSEDDARQRTAPTKPMRGQSSSAVRAGARAHEPSSIATVGQGGHRSPGQRDVCQQSVREPCFSLARAGPHRVNKLARQAVTCVRQLIEHRTDRGQQTSRLRRQQNARNTYNRQPGTTSHFPSLGIVNQQESRRSLQAQSDCLGLSRVHGATQLRDRATVRKRCYAQPSFRKRLADPLGSGAIRLGPGLPMNRWWD